MMIWVRKIRDEQNRVRWEFSDDLKSYRSDVASRFFQLNDMVRGLCCQVLGEDSAATRKIVLGYIIKARRFAGAREWFPVPDIDNEIVLRKLSHTGLWTRF